MLTTKESIKKPLVGGLKKYFFIMIINCIISKVTLKKTKYFKYFAITKLEEEKMELK